MNLNLTVVSRQRIKMTAKAIHPLQNWMPKHEFQIVKTYVKYAKNTNLADLKKEEHVEISFNVEVIFDERQEPEDSDDEYLDYSQLKFVFRFEGKTTNTCVEFSSYGFLTKSLEKAKDILLDNLANRCCNVKRLTIRSQLEGLPYPDYREDSGVQIEFMEWAETGTILQAFAKAAHWSDTLEQLEILGESELPSSDELEEWVLSTKPQKLKSLRLVCNDSHDGEPVHQRARSFVQAFPSLESLRLTCKEGDTSFGFCLPDFFKGFGGVMDLKTLIIEGDMNTVDLGRRNFPKLCMELLQLGQLEHLTIDLKGKQRDDICYSDFIVGLLNLKGSKLKEISLHGLGASEKCFDSLIEHFSVENPPLVFFDLETDSLQNDQLSKLLNLLSLNETKLPKEPTLKTLDALLILRRFQDVKPSSEHGMLQLWPQLLANASNWKLQMKGMGKMAASRWFFSRDLLAPTLLYSLIRERPDIIAAHVSAQKFSKRPLHEDERSSKRAKVATAS